MMQVKFHRDQELAFPAVCVGCCAPGPGGTFFLPRWSHAKNALKLRRVGVPACVECARRMHRQRLFRNAMWYVVGPVVLVGALIALGRRWNEMWVGGTALVVVYGPLLVLEIARPRAVRVAKAGGTARVLMEANFIRLEFANDVYARAFAEMNRLPFGPS